MNLLLGAFALACGVILTTQIGNNTQLAKCLHNSYIPAAVNMAVGVIVTLLVLLVAHKPWPSAELVRGAPWWSWLAGGVLGTAYLTGNILLAPKLGAAALVGFIVTGQLLSAVVADHYAWLGFEQHTASIWRIAGCLLMAAGVFLIAKF